MARVRCVLASRTEHTKISAKGQVVIPKASRNRLDWPSGTRLVIEQVAGGIALRPAAEERGRLTMEEFKAAYSGSSLSMEEIDAVVEKARAEHYRREYRSDE
ncbi:MAG: AbrB/MazE/SpoVT family DNA-binding domain-containing protein [Sphingomonadaceae bacterium]